MEVKSVNSPMPGRIMEVSVSTGDSVSRGSVLVVLESMKMENEIISEYEGTVAQIHVAEGDFVAEGAALADIEVA